MLIKPARKHSVLIALVLSLPSVLYAADEPPKLKDIVDTKVPEEAIEKTIR